jgi:hypothetical protein
MPLSNACQMILNAPANVQTLLTIVATVFCGTNNNSKHHVLFVAFEFSTRLASTYAGREREGKRGKDRHTCTNAFVIRITSFTKNVLLLLHFQLKANTLLCLIMWTRLDRSQAPPTKKIVHAFVDAWTHPSVTSLLHALV